MIGLEREPYRLPSSSKEKPPVIRRAHCARLCGLQCWSQEEAGCGQWPVGAVTSCTGFPSPTSVYIFGITLGIVSCTQVTSTIAVYSGGRGKLHSEAVWANAPTPMKPSKSSVSTLGVGISQPGLSIYRSFNARHPHCVLGRDWWRVPRTGLLPPTQCPRTHISPDVSRKTRPLRFKR